ncbi:hypothetical protein WEI85_01610 [Actinomycetes bacterium KLBMP 9797]
MSGAPTPADFGWSGPVLLPDLWDQLTEPDAIVTFSALAYARMRTQEAAVRGEARAAEAALRRKFIEQEGPIQNASYGRNLLGGCAVTERTQRIGGRDVTVRRLHSVLNTDVPVLVELEAKCAALADDAITAFCARSGLERQMRTSTDQIYSAMTRVLRAADELAAGAVDGARRKDLLAMATNEYAHARRQVNAAIQRQSRLTYFEGALWGSLGTIALCALLGAASAQWWSSAVRTPAFVAAIVFGALGAVASVSQRISTGRLVLDFTVPRWQMITLGALRPVIGAVFGAVAHFGLAGGVFSAGGGADEAAAVGLSAVIGFAAGFTERLATDMIERAGRVAFGDTPDPATDPDPPARSARQR